MVQLTHYLTLKAIPQMEMTQSDVVAHCLQTLHKFLPLYQGEIGVSFPAYGLGRSLGGIIRLFGTETNCRQLKVQLAEHGLQDYALISEISAIPDVIVEYHCYKRVHRKGQSAIRRAEKYLSQTARWNESVREGMLRNQQQKPSFPHLKLKSASTGQAFILAIQQHRLKKPSLGIFNAYGLSQTATVPHF